MKQPAGIGSAVVWENPADFAVTFLGFKRYFTLENKICKALFDLARNIPKHWKKCPVKVVRRDRVQTAGGAVASALYGSAFQMQAANMRAAAIHRSKRRAAGVPVKGPTIQFFQPGPRAAIRLRQEWLIDFIKRYTVNPTVTPLVERVPRSPAPSTTPSKIDLGPRLPGFPKFLDDL